MPIFASKALTTWKQKIPLTKKRLPQGSTEPQHSSFWAYLACATSEIFKLLFTHLLNFGIQLLRYLVRMTLSAKIELIHCSDLSSRDRNCQDNIQLLFLQQIEKFSVYCVTNWHYKVLGRKQTSESLFTHLRSQCDNLSYNCSSINTYVSCIVQELSHPIHFNTSESHSHMFASLFRRLYI